MRRTAILPVTLAWLLGVFLGCTEDTRPRARADRQTGGDAGRDATPEAGPDASAVDGDAEAAPRDAPCTPGSSPIDVVHGDSGGCYATLPAGFDPAQVEIDTVLNNNPAYTVALTRLAGPCGIHPGYWTVSASTVEFCGLCDAPYSLSFVAVDRCSPYPPPPDASDGCVQETVALSVRMEKAACFLDVPQGTDLSVPIALQGEFGMLPQTFYLSEMTGPCNSISNSGWEYVSATTLEVCGQACTFFSLSPYTVTLECGVHAPDAGREGGAVGDAASDATDADIGD